MSRIVRFFENFCPNCCRNVGIPLLGDFAYGEFLYQTEDGAQFTYLNTFDEEGWDRIEEIFKVNAHISLDKNNKKIDIFQNVVKKCADKFEGKSYSTEFPLCPECGNKINSYSDEIMMFDKELKKASWSEFMSLSPDDQVAKVLNQIEEEINSQQDV